MGNLAGSSGRADVLFTASGTFTPPRLVSASAPLVCDITITGGGGGGGAVTGYYGGLLGGAGGSAGQVLVLSGYPVTSPMSVIVGAAGTGAVGGASPVSQTSGGQSSFGPVVAVGGLAAGTTPLMPLTSAGANGTAIPAIAVVIPAGAVTQPNQTGDLVHYSGSYSGSSAFSYNGASIFSGVATNGAGQWVVAGGNTQWTGYSPNGTAWYTTLLGASGFTAICYVPLTNTYVMVNNQYSRITSGSNFTGTTDYSGNNVWTSNVMPAATQPFSAVCAGVVTGSARVVAVAPSATAALSSAYCDGNTSTTWTARAMPTIANWQGVAWGNGVYTAIASGTAAAATTPDGLTWTARVMPNTNVWSSITYGAGLFVAVANGSNVAATSPDGATWTTRTLPSAAGWLSVSYGVGVGFAVVGGSSIATSPDGITWSAATMPAPTGGAKAIGVGSVVAATATAPSTLALRTDLTASGGSSGNPTFGGSGGFGGDYFPPLAQTGTTGAAAMAGVVPGAGGGGAGNNLVNVNGGAGGPGTVRISYWK